MVKLFDAWRYLGYSKAELKPYDIQIAKDNLRVLGKALLVAAALTLLELGVIWVYIQTGHGITASLRYTMGLLAATSAAIVLVGGLYLLLKNKPYRPFSSRLLTTLFLSGWSLLYIIISVYIDPQDYAVLACGLFLLIQVMFDAYPLDNLCFVGCVYAVFVISCYTNKAIQIFLYDVVDSLPFLIVGLFLSWMKSRSKWESLINADAAVKLKTQQLENQLLQSQVAVMLSQIQPHFLYNSLGVIRALCQKDPKLAEQATLQFANFLRGNMDSLQSYKPVLFSQELEHTQNYLALEKLRFADHLTVVFDLQPTLFSIPTLTLQPIVENAVRYGINKKEKKGTVTISTREYADCIKITVADDGAGFEPSTIQSMDGNHIGLDNVRHRLEQICGGTLDIQSTLGVGTVATITLPKLHSEEYNFAADREIHRKDP